MRACVCACVRVCVRVRVRVRACARARARARTICCYTEHMLRAAWDVLDVPTVLCPRVTSFLLHACTATVNPALCMCVVYDSIYTGTYNIIYQSPH